MAIAIGPRAYHLIATSRRAPHRVAHALIGQIKSGVYAEGAWLPKEPALLREFAVGRPALREAMTILQCLGVVDVRRSVGVKVLWAGQTRNALNGATLDLLTVLEACCLFEVESCALAAGLSPPFALPSLISERLDVEDLYQFHIALAQATGNGAILACVTNLWEALLARPPLRELFTMALKPAGAEALALQALVVQALADSDPGAARNAVKTLFNLYLTRVLDTEEQERVRRVRQESQERRSIWGGRLRADSWPVTRDGAAAPAP